MSTIPLNKNNYQKTKALAQEPAVEMAPENGLPHEKWSNEFLRKLKWEGSESLQLWAEPVLAHLATYIGALEGTLYHLGSEENNLLLTAWYAKTYLDKVPKSLAMGEGTIGACAKRQKTIDVELQDQDFLPYSGVGQLKPGFLRCVPLMNNYHLVGVLELSFLRRPDESALQNLDNQLPTLAAALHSILNDRRLRANLETLRENEERLQTIDEVVTQGIAFVDGHTIVEHNLAFAKIFADEHADLTHQAMHRFLEQDQLETLLASDARVIVELEAQATSGKLLFLEAQKRPATFRGRPVVVLSMQNITQRKEAEARLVSSEQKLEAANRLVELSREVEEQNKKIKASINYAQRIQKSLLPCPEEMAKGLKDYFALYITKDVVSGDFYWFHQIDDHKALVAAVDCTGHGVPGAFMSFIGFTGLNVIAQHRNETNPSRILALLHEEVVKSFRQGQKVASADGMDVALLYLDYRNKEWAYSGAHRPLIQVKAGKVRKHKGTRAPIGGKHHSDVSYLLHEGKWETGDMFYLFSDGYADQFNAAGKKFMTKRLHRYLGEIASLSCTAQHQQLQETFEAWKGDYKQIDDVLLMGIKMP